MNKMRVCLIGRFAPYLDEGTRNVGIYLARELSHRHDVITKRPDDVFSRSFWNDMKAFNPQIVHYVAGPTIFSFMITKALSFYCKDAKTVMSAILPLVPSYLKRIVPLLKPDLILTQSRQSEEMFASLGFRTVFLPNGVDIKRFAPADKKTKGALREKYGLDKSRFTVLHVGHIEKQRNLKILSEVQRAGNQVLIVGSPSSRDYSQHLCQELKEDGCIIWRTYLNNVEEIYKLSDCFVFPVKEKRSCIEMPLSVLEAMSCNLPVISTKFGALPGVFEEGASPYFIAGEEEIMEKLEEIKQGRIEIKTRERVLSYSWAKVAAKLEEIYRDVICNSG